MGTPLSTNIFRPRPHLCPALCLMSGSLELLLTLSPDTSSSVFSPQGGHQALWDQGDNLKVLILLCPDRQPHVLPLVSLGHQVSENLAFQVFGKVRDGIWSAYMSLGLYVDVFCLLLSGLLLVCLYPVFQNFTIICRPLISYFFFFAHFVGGRKTCKCCGQSTKLNQEFTVGRLSAYSTALRRVCVCLFTHASLMPGSEGAFCRCSVNGINARILSEWADGSRSLRWGSPAR